MMDTDDFLRRSLAVVGSRMGQSKVAFASSNRENEASMDNNTDEDHFDDNDDIRSTTTSMLSSSHSLSNMSVRTGRSWNDERQRQVTKIMTEQIRAALAAEYEVDHSMAELRRKFELVRGSSTLNYRPGRAGTQTREKRERGVSREEFVSLMHMMGYPMSQKQSDKLFDKMDRDRSEKVTPEEFVFHYLALDIAPAVKSRSSSRRTASNQSVRVNVDSFIDRFRDALQRRVSTQQQRALEKVRKNLPPHMKEFAVVPIDQAIKRTRPVNRRKDDVEMHERVRFAMEKAFSHHDMFADGLLSRSELNLALRKLGARPSDELLDTLMAEFRGANQGAINALGTGHKAAVVRKRVRRDVSDKKPVRARRQGLEEGPRPERDDADVVVEKCTFAYRKFIDRIMEPLLPLPPAVTPADPLHDGFYTTPKLPEELEGVDLAPSSLAVAFRATTSASTRQGQRETPADEYPVDQDSDDEPDSDDERRMRLATKELRLLNVTPALLRQAAPVLKSEERQRRKAAAAAAAAAGSDSEDGGGGGAAVSANYRQNWSYNQVGPSALDVKNMTDEERQKHRKKQLRQQRQAHKHKSVGEIDAERHNRLNWSFNGRVGTDRPYESRRFVRGVTQAGYKRVEDATEKERLERDQYAGQEERKQREHQQRQRMQAEARRAHNKHFAKQPRKVVQFGSKRKSATVQASGGGSGGGGGGVAYHGPKIVTHSMS
eukprot:TRINITY_DN65850_c5_g3_i1.p1 TRINITY_DN65850_c5_g3~~TRINITY_DN65850_c5_g3_i1.p1  ORF type:complete len:716 (+),score=405.01 TRINITY_DN65850_c5_g3_i1:36-2183(+)